jgi:hypothetical protein
MSEINYFKKIILCSGDVRADIDHLYIKIIYLVNFCYITIDDTIYISGSRFDFASYLHVPYLILCCLGLCFNPMDPYGASYLFLSILIIPTTTFSICFLTG